MVFRKPYAFFIKHFKHIHGVLALLMTYCIIKTVSLFFYFNEYIDLMLNINDDSIIKSLIPNLFKIIPIIIILTAFALLATMVTKKKPKRDYIIIIIIYLYLFTVIMISNNMLNSLVSQLIESKIARLIRDLLLLGIIFQFLPLILTSIHATGFDIKKFEFERDLKELEISDEDREEVELQVNYDKNLSIRNIRRSLRYLKYSIKENIIIWLILFVIFIITISTVICTKKTNITLKKLNENINANGFNIKVIDTYVTDNDYNGNKISDNSYFIVKIKIKSIGKSSKNFDPGSFNLKIHNHSFYPILNSNNDFFDIGNVYLNDKIDSEFTNFILVYELPKKLKNVNKELYIVDRLHKTNNKFNMFKVKIKTKDLDNNIEEKKYDINEEISFQDSVLKNVKLNVNSFTYAKEFKLDYNFCIQNECFKSVEYLKPKINENYDKALIKIEGNLNSDIEIKNISNLYDFIEKFGYLEVIVNNEKFIFKFNDNQIKSKKSNDDNIYYIEVNEKIMDASNIMLNFKIRNKNYKYILK